jgi:cardiolipin synthase A/B
VILAAIAEGPKTAAQLAVEGDLHRRLVIEVIIRLMRAGWVELYQAAEGITFNVSTAGKVAAGSSELPDTSKRISRWMNFVIDRLTGTLYRSRELPFYHKHVIADRSPNERLVWMQPLNIHVNDSVGALVATLFSDDERFVSMDWAGDRLVERFALASVRGDRVEGLPPRAPVELKRMAIEAAKTASTKPLATGPIMYRPPPMPRQFRERPEEVRPIIFQSSDLIFGGQGHEAALDGAIRKARHRIIIHSTFIAADKFDARKPLLIDATRRGVKIDVMWGEDEERSLSRSTRAAVDRIRREIASIGLLQVHPFSTGSHAKVLIADDGNPDRHFAIVGSCNWFSSGFHSVEVSVRIRDPIMVAIVVEQLAELSRGMDGHWTELTNELARLATLIRLRRSSGGAVGQASLVLGAQHAHYVRQARDEALRRVFVTSHRFSATGRPAVVIPAIAAAEARGISAKLYFGMTSGGLKAEDAAAITRQAGGSGIRLRPIHEPRLHAKILGWDDDFLVVTSQNWLSADPSESNLRKEIGIFIHASGIARLAIEKLEAICTTGTI